MERHEAIVIGAGHAGLAVSHELTALGVEHVVLERGRVGESWRSQRWESFALNTPSWCNRLPGDSDADVPEPADGFQSRAGFVGRLEAYAARWRLPVREGAPVTAVRTDGADGARHAWTVLVGGPAGNRLAARAVVVASGIQNVPFVPPVAAAIPSWVTQLHSLEYRSGAALPEGAVLVVGSGQTGGQVTEDLLDAGREVFLSPSRVGRLPRRYRGRDVLEWLVPWGFFDMPLEKLADPQERFQRQPLTSGLGRHGHTVSLQWLATRGATLVGRIRDVEGNALLLDDTVAECIRFGDRVSAEARRQLDGGIEAAGLGLPPLDEDPADEPHPDPDRVRSPERLELAASGIRTVIWATGVRGEFGWLPAPVLDGAGAPVHRRGVTAMPGLYVLGFPWLSTRGSGIIYGAANDAQRIAGEVRAGLV